jgi:hypothetical protein
MHFIIVHNAHQLKEAAKALREIEKKICFSTPFAAAEYMGLGYLKALEKVGQDITSPNFTLYVDCATSAGLVLEALRCGFKNIFFEGDSGYFEKLLQIAHSYQAALYPCSDKEIAALDLENHTHVYQTCKAWLLELKT